MNQVVKSQQAPDDRLSQAMEQQAEEARRAPGRRRAARRLAIGAVAIAALMIGFGTWSHMQRLGSAKAALAMRESAVPMVRTIDLKAETGPRIVDLPATMQAFDSATLFARATGYIAQRNVDIGSIVRKGDVLVVIAAPDLDQQLAQARAQLAQMQAGFVQAEAQRSLADLNNRRTSRLVVEGWNSRQQGDTDRTTLATQSAGVRVAAANIAAQQAQVDRLVQLTGFERVIAPFDGVITSRQVDVGTLVTADQAGGTPLFSIARTDVLRVQVYVPQADFFSVRDGDDATVSVPQLPGRLFHGKVARNAGALGAETRTLLTEVDVANPDKLLSPGLYGIVHLELHRTGAVVLVPSEAVIFGEHGLSAAVVEDGKLAVRPLTLEADDGAQVEVRAGLRPGDKLILNPPVNPTPGMKVRTS